MTVSDLSESIFMSRFTNDGKRDQSFSADAIVQVTLSTALPYVQTCSFRLTAASSLL